MKWKEIVDRCRLRRVPEGFGWVDHRFVRDGHVRGRSGGALALYLFLVTVADGDGVSYYSDETLCGHLDGARKVFFCDYKKNFSSHRLHFSIHFPEKKHSDVTSCT